MFRIATLVRGGLFAAAIALWSIPSIASAHHGGCFPTVSYCQPCYTHCYTPCYTPCYRPVIYTQPLIVQPCVKPLIVTPYVQTYGTARIIVR